MIDNSATSNLQSSSDSVPRVSAAAPETVSGQHGPAADTLVRFDRQTLQKLPRVPPGGRGPRLRQRRQALLNDPRLMLGAVTAELQYPNLQPGGVADGRQIGHLELDVAPKSPGSPTLDADRVRGHGCAEQVR